MENANVQLIPLERPNVPDTDKIRSALERIPQPPAQALVQQTAAALRHRLQYQYDVARAWGFIKLVIWLVKRLGNFDGGPNVTLWEANANDLALIAHYYHAANTVHVTVNGSVVCDNTQSRGQHFVPGRWVEFVLTTADCIERAAQHQVEREAEREQLELIEQLTAQV
jgi:hypothetical protein